MWIHVGLHSVCRKSRLHTDLASSSASVTAPFGLQSYLHFASVGLGWVRSKDLLRRYDQSPISGPCLSPCRDGGDCSGHGAILRGDSVAERDVSVPMRQVMTGVGRSHHLRAKGVMLSSLNRDQEGRI